MRCCKIASLFVGIAIISGPIYAENDCGTPFRNSDALCVQAKKDCTAAAVSVRDTCRADNQAAKAEEKRKKAEQKSTITTTTTTKPKIYTPPDSNDRPIGQGQQLPAPTPH